MSEADRGLRLDAAVALGVRVASAVLVFGLQVLLARLMDLESYGRYVTLWTWLIAIGAFGAIGFPDASLRFLPRYVARGRADRASAYWLFALACVGIASGAMALGGLVVAGALGIDRAAGLIVLCLAIGLPFLAVENLLEGVARSFGWMRITLVTGYLVRPALIGATCLALATAGVRLDLATVGGVTIAALAITCVALLLVIARRMRRGVAAAATSAAQRMLWLRAALPLLLVSGLEDLLTGSDVLLLSLLMRPEDVAVYFAAARTLALASFVHFAIGFVSGRSFALAQSDRSRLQDAVLETSRLTFWMTLLALAATLAAGPWLLAEFGEAFRAGYPLMLILAAGLLARSMAGQAAELLIVLGRQRESLAIGAAALAASVLLTLALAPALGLAGAAIAASAAAALRAVALIVAVRRCTGLRTLSLAPPRLFTPRPA